MRRGVIRVCRMRVNARHANFCVGVFVGRRIRVTLYAPSFRSRGQINNGNATPRDSVYRGSVRLVCITSHIGEPLHSLQLIYSDHDCAFNKIEIGLRFSPEAFSLFQRNNIFATNCNIFFYQSIVYYSSRDHTLSPQIAFKNCQSRVAIIYELNTTEFIAASANGFAMIIFHHTLIISVTY